MNLEFLFSAAGVIATIGWLALLISPFIPEWSDKLASLVIPILLSLGYVLLVLFYPSEGGGGFGSLADVGELFSHQQALLAGWVHFLAFDLLVGAWICRVARQEGLNFWLIIPCLPLTFLFGPLGFLAFSLIRTFSSMPLSSD